MTTDVMYLTVEKEEAARELTDEHGDYEAMERDDEIIVTRSTFGSGAHRATLTDDESGTEERRTRVEYSHDAVRDTLEEYAT